MQHPDESTGDGGHLDVLILRELAHRDGARSSQIAVAVCVDTATARLAIERLERDGMIRRFMGLRVTNQALDAYGTALWRCEKCGCVDEHACEPGCVWV